jgi:hypothetical protein
VTIPEKIPNETTRKALAEKDLVTFETPEELFEDLGIQWSALEEPGYSSRKAEREKNEPPKFCQLNFRPESTGKVATGRRSMGWSGSRTIRDSGAWMAKERAGIAKNQLNARPVFGAFVGQGQRESTGSLWPLS